MKKNRFLRYVAAGVVALAPYVAGTLIQGKLSELEERVRPAARSTLPDGVAGQVDSRTGEGSYGIDFQSPFSENTMHHEMAHALGVADGSPRGEYLADIYALWKTGKTDYVRGPFYRPPINL